MSLRRRRYALLGLRSTAGQGHFRPLRLPVSARAKEMIRDDIKAATIAAMKSGDKDTVGTLRLVQSEVKNRDIEARTGGAPADDDQLVTEVLQRMIKKRRESADIYRKNGREDRAAAEESEITIIERFLPAQISEEEAQAKIREINAETGASS